MTIRRHFLINKKFQFRFSFYTCTWLFALSMVYPMAIANIFDWFIRFAAVNPMAAPPQIVYGTRDQIFWLIVLMQIFFVGMTFFISVFISHKIAGPLSKLGRSFVGLSTGQLQPKIAFRKGDHFPELANEFNFTVQRIRDTITANSVRAANTIAKLEQVLETAPADQRKGLKEAIAILQNIRRPLKNSEG